jgi:hypothetical protein
VLGLLQIRPELRVIGYSEATWDAHHDVVACMRSSQPFAADACPLVFGIEPPPTREPARDTLVAARPNVVSRN